jgi:hypothetical protein
MVFASSLAFGALVQVGSAFDALFSLLVEAYLLSPTQWSAVLGSGQRGGVPGNDPVGHRLARYSRRAWPGLIFVCLV